METCTDLNIKPSHTHKPPLKPHHIPKTTLQRKSKPPIFPHNVLINLQRHTYTVHTHTHSMHRLLSALYYKDSNQTRIHSSFTDLQELAIKVQLIRSDCLIQSEPCRGGIWLECSPTGNDWQLSCWTSVTQSVCVLYVDFLHALCMWVTQGQRLDLPFRTNTGHRLVLVSQSGKCGDHLDMQKTWFYVRLF